MLSNPKWHWSASSWGLDQSCKRARFLHSCQGGTGIEPASYDAKSLPLEFGLAYHTALAEVRRGKTPEAALAAGLTGHILPLLPTLPDLDKQEVQWALAGMFWAWYRARWPHEQQVYRMQEAVVEQKLVDKESGLVAVMDLLVPLASTGQWIYQDEKTTGVLPSDTWMEEWTRKVQLASGPIVAKGGLGIDVAYSVIVGHYKGYRKKDPKTGERRWVSPFTQGWRQGCGFDGLPLGWEPKRPSAWKGWEPFYTWEVWPSARLLVDRLPIELLQSLIVESPPIQVAPRQQAAWLRQGTLREEKLIQLAGLSAQGSVPQALMDSAAPQNWDACKSDRFGTCRFYKLCWLEQVEADPVGSGFYRPRKDEWGDLMEGEDGDD